jgi:hypothetical protein
VKLRQAVMWELSVSTLHSWAAIHAEITRALEAGKAPKAALYAELRQHEHRHGVSPRAMQMLRWRIADEAEPGRQGPNRPSAYSHLVVQLDERRQLPQDLGRRQAAGRTAHSKPPR